MLADRVSVVIEHVGLSQKAFAEELGITPGYITDVLKGRSGLSQVILLKIREKYGINLHWLLTGEGTPFVETEAIMKVRPLPDPLAGLGPKQRKVVEDMIAVLGKGEVQPSGGRQREAYSHSDLREVGLVASIAAGDPIEAIEHPEEVYLLPRKIFRQKGKLFLLKVRGDSMVGAGIFDGDLAVMERMQDAERLRDGEIVAISLDGAATLKRFLRDNGSIILRAENKAYPDRVVTAREFPILWGRFVGLVRREVES